MGDTSRKMFVDTSTSRSEGSPDSSSGNMSGNSFTTGIEFLYQS
jgi:hypothetical protein